MNQIDEVFVGFTRNNKSKFPFDGLISKFQIFKRHRRDKKKTPMDCEMCLLGTYRVRKQKWHRALKDSSNDIFEPTTIILVPFESCI